MNVHVALLRGINVGGKNLIRMPALKACFEAQGARDVATYIQSGNVLFTAASRDREPLTRRLEAALSTAFAYKSRLVVRSFEEMQTVVQGAPDRFGKRPDAYRYDVIYLREPLTAGEAIKHVRAKAGVDRVARGETVLYFSRLISRAAQSHLPRIAGSPVYQDLTIRNWNTTSRLLELMRRMRSTSV